MSIINSVRETIAAVCNGAWLVAIQHLLRTGIPGVASRSIAMTVVLSTLSLPGTTIAQSWRQLPGLGTDVGIGANYSVWLTGLGGNARGGYGIFYWNGSGWIFAGGYAIRVSVAPDGTPWVVNNEGKIFRLVNGSWQQLPGLASDIGIGANGAVWITGLGGNATGGYGIFYWNGSDWVFTNGYAVSVDVAPDGTPWVCNSEGKIFVLQ